MFVKTLINGKPSELVSLQDRGLAYGDGLFETIKISNGRAVYLSDHLTRLEAGCRRLGIYYNSREIETDVLTLLADGAGKIDSAVLKIIMTRESTGRSYQTSRQAGSNRILSLTETDSSVDYQQKQHNGVSVIVCNTRLSINPKLAGIKHLCRLENVLARAEWDSHCIAEGLMLDLQGRLIEGTMSNVFLVNESGLYTPSLHRCGVEGIIRKQIIDNCAKQLGKEVFVSDLTLDNVYQANEVFVCNSLVGIWPVTAIGCHRKKVGKVTRALQNLLSIQSGEC